MSLTDRLWYSLIAIPGASLERAFWYVTLAGFAWVALHLVLARWLARRRIADKPPTWGQMGREVLYSARSLAIYGLVGGCMVFSVTSAKVGPVRFVMLGVVRGGVEHFAAPRADEPAGIHLVAAVPQHVEPDLPEHEDRKSERVDRQRKDYQRGDPRLHEGRTLQTPDRRVSTAAEGLRPMLDSRWRGSSARQIGQVLPNGIQ
ncbi:MAG: hypothetical protein WD872_13300 [Pirellulaceae bacterium]